MNWCLMDTFRSPASRTLFLVTSAPGPAVVGTAMKGAQRVVKGLGDHLEEIVQIRRFPSVGEHRRDALAGVHGGRRRRWR